MNQVRGGYLFGADRRGHMIEQSRRDAPGLVMREREVNDYTGVTWGTGRGRNASNRCANTSHIDICRTGSL